MIFIKKNFSNLFIIHKNNELILKKNKIIFLI